jgi:tetratricopeptide (TPR) repeat protein
METLIPQQLAEEGQAEYQKKEYRSAARLFKAAADGFLTAGDNLEAAHMANDCSVAYLQAGDAQSALEAVAGTAQIFALNGAIKQQAMALGNQAAALENLHRLDEAFQLYQKSAGLLDEIGESDLRAYVLQSISSIQLRNRRFLEAYATMRAGVMGIRKPTFKQRVLKALIQIPYKLIR